LINVILSANWWRIQYHTRDKHETTTVKKCLKISFKWQLDGLLNTTQKT